MYVFSGHARLIAATLALGVLAGCAEGVSSPSAPPPQAAANPEPQLAGAWYQVYFDSNSSQIGERGRMIVKTVAYVTLNNSATRVTVIGKTDRVGAPPANLALAQRRAEAIRDALITAGVPAARIDTSWMGESRKQDVATADDIAERRNRVVDVTVVRETH